MTFTGHGIDETSGFREKTRDGGNKENGESKEEKENSILRFCFAWTCKKVDFEYLLPYYFTETFQQNEWIHAESDMSYHMI